LERKFLPTLYGIYKDLHRRMIPEDRLSDGVNIYFEDGRIKRRSGYTVMGQQLSGPVTSLTWYELIGTAAKFLVATTTKDAYTYDSTDDEWDYITPIYNTGSVSCSASTAVTGTSTVWSTSWPAATYAIKFGTDDPNATGTPDAWYTVASFDSATGLTLNTAGPTATTVAYSIRMCFQNDEDQPHDIALPVKTYDRLLVATNGIDAPKKWDGTGYMEDLGGTPNVARYCGYFGSVGYEHLYLGWTVDAGNDQPFTLEMSDAGDPEDYGEGLYYDLMNTNDEVVGMKSLGQNVIVYKKESISVAFPTGVADDPLQFKQNHINGIGTPTIRTVADFGNFHIFMGTDNVYKFDGNQIVPIGNEIVNTMLREINAGMAHRAFSLAMRDKHLYLLLIPVDGDYPDKAYVYNYIDNNWTIWEFEHAMTAAGYWFSDASETWATWDASAITWDDLLSSGERWSDFLSYGGTPTFLFGDKDGYVYEYGAGTDNGTIISANFTTRDYPINDPVQLFKLLQVIVGFAQSGAGTMRLRASVNFGGEWSQWGVINLAGTTEYMERIVNFLMRGQQVRFYVENVDGVNFEIESIAVGFNNAGE
jgi:hypothetical protein